MTAIEIARQLAALGQSEGAIKAYGVAIHQAQEPAEELEGALYILQNGGDYKVSYSTLIDLYRRGQFREECLSILTQAFYQPNMKLFKSRYENNRRLLARYPYLFRQDFIDFEFLPIRFYPFDDNRYVPFYQGEKRFGEYADVKKPVVSRNFFHDLENPILAKDVFSQYELEYLNDNVRPSEYVARDNHIYLHYTDWGEFCSWLQVLNLRPLLEGKKLVFLIGDEAEQYPIDFKERFGIDYSQYPLKPVGIREINKLIWHTQLSSHNGGDFFNEILDNHPNLLALTSVMFDSIEQGINTWRGNLKCAKNDKEAEDIVVNGRTGYCAQVVRELCRMQDPSDKDILVAMYLSDSDIAAPLDPAARIAPALLFQPHFENITYKLRVNSGGGTVLASKQYDTVISSPIFRGFKYIKTFTPLRRFTTSYGASVKFMYTRASRPQEEKPGKPDKKTKKIAVVPDAVTQRILTRSFMIDWQDRLYADCVLVRFEDGKLNPKATFTALAAFLDIPYTESMTYCSLLGARDASSMEGNVLGFDPAAIYRTYDEYANDAERTYIEYCLRDAYEYYGYDFQYYDGRPMTVEELDALTASFTTIDHYSRETWRKIYRKGQVSLNGERVDEELEKKVQEEMLENHIRAFHRNREKNTRILLRGLRFVNRRGQPLHMMPKLELDPALLEQPLYH